MIAGDWTDLVFHVLAHVDVDVAAGVHDRTYQTWAEGSLGPAAARELGQLRLDLRLAAQTHEVLAEAQLLAWLFDDVARAGPSFPRALSELSPGDVDRPHLLVRLAGKPAPELLFCAAALEAPHHAMLPPPTEAEDFATLVAQVARAAPSLDPKAIVHVRALRLRGRVHDARIWVGLPGDAPPAAPAEHVAWQAAHEATVAELAGYGLAFAEHEHAAIALLAARAANVGQAAPHAAWLAQLRAPSSSLASLAPEARAVVVAALERSGT